MGTSKCPYCLELDNFCGASQFSSVVAFFMPHWREKEHAVRVGQDLLHQT